MADNKLRELEKTWLINKTAESAATLAKEMLRTGQGNFESQFIIKKKDKNDYYLRSTSAYSNQTGRYRWSHQFTNKIEKAKKFSQTQVYSFVSTNGISKANRAYGYGGIEEDKEELKGCEIIEIFHISLTGNTISIDDIIYQNKLKTAQKEKAAAEKKLKKLAEEESQLLKEIEEKNKLLGVKPEEFKDG